MIIIKNLDRIVGMTSNGHHIVEAYEDWNRHKPVYVFKFNYFHSGLKNNQIPVYLERIDVGGEYALYVMGFRSKTEITIDKTKFTGQYGPADMASEIRKVLKSLFAYLNIKS